MHIFHLNRVMFVLSTLMGIIVYLLLTGCMTFAELHVYLPTCEVMDRNFNCSTLIHLAN